MTLFLIYYTIREKGSCWDSETGYATIEANHEQHAMQLAATWIHGVNKIEIYGKVKREIRNN